MQGFQGAFIATGRDNRPSGTGFVVFDSEDAQTAAYKVSVAQHACCAIWHFCFQHGPKSHAAHGVDPHLKAKGGQVRKPGILAHHGLVHQELTLEVGCRLSFYAETAAAVQAASPAALTDHARNVWT